MTADRKIQLAKPSGRLLTLFESYFRWYIRRHFHALRVAHSERFPRQLAGPLIIYLNHPSWWDPLTCIMISRRFLPGADHYAPMDEAALKRYGFFARIGLFPVEMNTIRGAMQFVRYSEQVLSTPNSVLWLTPEGRFTDPRQRPLVFKDGLASLLARQPQAVLLPLAIEYIYWDERLPEIVVNCGTPIYTGGCDNYTPARWSATLESALTSTQDELVALAIIRDAANFEAILEGNAGVGFFYDLWQRLRSASRGEEYIAEHGSIHRP